MTTKKSSAKKSQRKYSKSVGKSVEAEMKSEKGRQVKEWKEREESHQQEASDCHRPLQGSKGRQEGTQEEIISQAISSLTEFLWTRLRRCIRSGETKGSRYKDCHRSMGGNIGRLIHRAVQPTFQQEVFRSVSHGRGTGSAIRGSKHTEGSKSPKYAIPPHEPKE
jgi:hypothetical protein